MVTAIMSVVINAVDRASGAIGSTRESALRAQEATARAARTAGIAITALGAAALLAGRSVSKSFQEVEAAFANVTTLMEGADDAMNIFGDTVERLSTTLPVQGGQLEIVNGLYQVLSAGITDAADAQQVLTVAIKAGIAGVSDTFTAVDLLTTAINAYGLTAQDAAGISDILFTIVKRGKTTLSELGTSFGRVVAIAPALGVDLETVGAALATLTKVGQNTDEATTALRATFLAFIKPTDALKDRIEALGFASGQAIVEELGFAGALDAVFGPLEGNVAALGELVPNVRALQAVLPLTGTAAQTFAEDMEAMENATGAAGVAFGKAADTMASRITIAKNRIDAATLAIGEGATPAMANLTESVAFAAEGMAFFNEKTGGAIGALVVYGGAALSAIGPVIALLAQIKLMTIAKSLNTLALNAGSGAQVANTVAASHGIVVRALLAVKTGIVTAAQWAWNVALSANPIGIIIIAIVALIAALAFLWVHQEDVRRGLEGLWNFIKPIFIPIIEALTFAWAKLSEGVLWLIDNILPLLFPPLLIWKLFGEDIMKAWGGVVEFFSGLWNAIVQGITAFGSFVLGLGNTFLNWLVEGFTGILGQLWDLGVQIMTAILQGIFDTIQGAGGFFQDIAGQIIGFFTGSPQLNPRLRRLFSGIGTEMGAEIGRGLTGGIEAAEEAVIGATERLSVVGGRPGAAAAGTQITITIGSIVASGAEEGRLAAESLMDDLRRRGIRVGPA